MFQSVSDLQNKCRSPTWPRWPVHHSRVSSLFSSNRAIAVSSDLQSTKPGSTCEPYECDECCQSHLRSSDVEEGQQLHRRGFGFQVSGFSWENHQLIVLQEDCMPLRHQFGARACLSIVFCDSDVVYTGKTLSTEKQSQADSYELDVEAANVYT